MAGIVDISFESDVSKSLKDLEKLKKKLEEIDKLRSGSVAPPIIEDESEYKKRKQRAKKIADEEVKSYSDVQKRINDMIMVNSNKNAKLSASAIKDLLKEQENASKQEISNKKLLEDTKLILIRNGAKGALKLEFDALSQRKNITRQEIDDFRSRLKEKLAIRQGIAKQEAMGMAQLMLGQMVTQDLRSNVAEMARFEETIYGIGIVGKKSLPEIMNLRNEMFDLGRIIPRMTQDIADNIITIQRTGKSYEEAMTIIKNSSMLAVAGQESIKNATDVLNKVLVAFNIEAENSTAAMNSLHTATINTPLDLAKIDESLRNAGAGMRNFIESTDKSGVALEEYKQRILDTTLSLVGGMTSMGMTASSAGVAVRNLGTKMLVMEKTAGMMFDKDVAEYFYDIEASGNRASDGLNKAGKGVRLTNEYLSELAQKDAPKAIEILSELYKRGDLGLRTISKMMTMRQAPAIISQLGLINGNMDAFIKRQTTGSDIQLDYNKALESWTNQLELAKNNMFALQGATSGYMQYVGKTGLKIFNESIKALDEMIDKNTTLGHILGVVKDAFIAMAMAGTMALGVKTIANISGMTEALTKFMTTLKLTTSMLSYIGLAIGVITIGVSAYNRYQENQAMILENQRKITAEYLKSQENLKISNILLQSQRNLFADMMTMDITSEWEKGQDIISAMVEQTSELVQLLKETKAIKGFEFPELKNSIALQKELNDTIENMLNKKIKESEVNEEAKKVFEELNSLEKEEANSRSKISSYRAYLKEIKELEKKHRQSKSEQESIALQRQIEFEKKMMSSIARGTADTYGGYSVKYLEDIYDKETQLLNEVQNKKLLKAKEYYGSEYALYEAYKLKQIRLDSDMLKRLNKMPTSIATSNSFDYFSQPNTGVMAEDVNKNIQEVINKNKEFFNKYKGKDLFDIFSTIDISEGKEILKVLKLTDAEQIAINLLLDERQKIETANLNIVNEKYTTLIEHMSSVNSILESVNKRTFEMALKNSDVKTFDGFVAKMEEMGYATEDINKDVAKLKDILKDAKKLDILVEEGKAMEALSYIRAFTEASEQLQEAIKKVKDESKEYTLGQLAGDDINKQKALMDAYNKNNKKQISDFKEIANEKASIGLIDKANEELNTRTQKTLDSYIGQLAVSNNKKKDEKQLTLDIFNIYDKNQILSAEMLKAKSTGIRLLQVEKQLLDENYKLEMKKNADNVKNLKEELGFGTTEGKDLEGLLNFEKQRLEIKNKNNTLTEEDTKRYKTIKELMETIQKSTEDENKYKIQSYENTKKQEEAIKNIKNDIKEQISLISEVNIAEDSILQSIKDRKREQQLSNEKIKEQLDIYQNTYQDMIDLYSSFSDSELDGLAIKDEEKKKIKDLVEKYKELVGLRKTIKSDDEKIAEIAKQIQDLSKDEYSLLEESITVNKEKKAQLDEQNKTGKLTIEQKQLEYQIEKDMLDLQVKRNNATIQNINSAMSLLDKIAGTNISGLTSDITGLFNQNAQGKNTFDIAGTATQGFNVANVGAILGIAGAGYATVTTAINMVQAADEKHNASQLEKWNRQLELSQKQLSAIESMRDTLSQYQNKLVDDLSKMPTFQNLNKVMPTYDVITKALRDGSKFLTDEVTLKYTFKSEGDFFGISIDKLDRTKTETKTISLKDLLGVDIKGLSLEEMKSYLNVLEIIGKLDLKSADIGKQIQDAFNLPGDIIEGVTDITSGLTALTTFLTGMGNPIGILLGEAINAIFGGDFELENVESNITEVISSIKNYVSALEMIKSNVDSLMTTATLKSFKGVVVNDIESAKKEYRKMAESILEPLKTGFYEQGAKAGKTTAVLDVEWETEVQNMTNTFMAGFEEISVTAGATIREGIINGVVDGVSAGNSTLKSMGEVIKEAMYNVNSVISDVLFGENLSNINKFTKEFNSNITKLKDMYKDDVFMLNVAITAESADYINKLFQEWEDVESKTEFKVNVIEKFITKAKENGKDLVKIGSVWGLTLKEIGMTAEEVYEAYKAGLYTLEEVQPLIGNYLDSMIQMRQMSMSEREILEDNLKIAKEKYNSDKENLTYKVDYLKASKAINDYDLNELAILKQSQISIDNIGQSQTYINKQKIIQLKAELVNEKSIAKQSQLKADIAQLEYESAQIWKEILADKKSFGKTQEWILKNTINIAEEEYKNAKTIEDKLIANNKINKATEEYMTYLKEQNAITNESIRQLNLLYSTELEIEQSNLKQLYIKRQEIALMDEGVEKTRVMAENNLEIVKSEKQIYETIKNKGELYDAMYNAVIDTNYFLSEQEDIYNNISSSIAKSIRDELKKTIINATMEGKLLDIKNTTIELQKLSLKLRDQEAQKAENLGNIESMNARRKALELKSIQLASMEYGTSDYWNFFDEVYKEYENFKNDVISIGGEITNEAVGTMTIDWTKVLDTSYLEDEIRSQSVKLKDMIANLATDLSSGEISSVLKLIDELWGDQAFEGSKNIERLTSAFQRLPTTLRDIKREISDFSIWEELKLENQILYGKEKQKELEQERQLFGYTEDRLNSLKEQHSLFIANMKASGKINELGEIDFGTSEDLKNSYDNRLSLIEKIESLLTEQKQTSLDLLNLEKQLSDLYTDRMTQYDDMQKSLFDNEQSLIDAYIQYTNIGKTQDEIDKINIERLKEKRIIIEEQLGYSESQIKSLYNQIILTDELGKTIVDKSKINESEFKTLQETNNLTNEQIDLLKEWLSVSGDILNSNKEINNDLKDGLISAFKESLNQANYEDGVSVLSDFFSENITDSIIDGLVNAKFKSQIESLYGSLYTTMAGGFNLGAIQQANASIQRIQLEAEVERNRLNVLKDMLNFKSNIDYSATQNKIQYSTGSNSTNTYVTNLNTNVSSLITTDKASTNKFAQEIVDGILVALNDKGYNMDKIKK